MKKLFFYALVVLFISPFTVNGQMIDEDGPEEQLLDTVYPYLLPILGQKVAERGYEQQLPFGLNINYTHNAMDLYISEFGLSVGSDPGSSINQLIDQYVTLETLNFQKVEAMSDGLNIRADFWLLPFQNVYGFYASNRGTTNVFLQPEWYDEDGNLLLSLPQFGAVAEFDATTWGIGTTLVYGYKNYFISVDGNISKSQSAILDEPAKLVVASARVGNLITFKNPHRKLAVYVGGMWRGFVDRKGNQGQIKINEVLPDLGSNVFPAINERVDANNGQINANNEAIAALDPSRPADQAKIAVLEAENAALNGKNQALGALDNGLQQVFASDVGYSIQKDIINNWSVQFGFNFQFNPHWMFRGEYGVANGNTFVLTGIQFRFGL